MPEQTTGEKLAAAFVTVTDRTVRLGADGPPVTCPDAKAAAAHAERQRRVVADLLDMAIDTVMPLARTAERAACVRHLRGQADRARRFWFVRDELHRAADRIEAQPPPTVDAGTVG